jgi:hypothetical protein
MLMLLMMVRVVPVFMRARFRCGSGWHSDPKHAPDKKGERDEHRDEPPQEGLHGSDANPATPTRQASQKHRKAGSILTNPLIF